MSIEFEDTNNDLRFTQINTNTPSGIIAFMIRHRLAENEKIASKRLLWLTMLLLLASVTILIASTIVSRGSKVTYRIPKEVIERLPPEVKINILYGN